MYLQMEYCDSGDLSGFLRKQKETKLAIHSVLDWTLQLCMAIKGLVLGLNILNLFFLLKTFKKHLHDRRIIHRYVKPANIFLTRGGRCIKLGDFGISYVQENTADAPGTMIGTPNYQVELSVKIIIIID